MKNCFFVVLLFVCFTVSSCAKKQTVVTKNNEKDVVGAQIPVGSIPDFSQEPSIRETETEKTPDFEIVYFPFDSSAIANDTLETLNKNAKYLKDNTTVNIVVEGHCDERGTTEYNLALGQKRAVKVKEYYVQLGVKPNRIATVSYGEEMPQDTRHNEAGWARNRRAETKIIK